MNEPNESERHAGVLSATTHETPEFFEFGGRQLLLKGTSGPPRVAARTAEGMPIRHDVSATGQTVPARHAGVLSATTHETPEFFEFGGRQLLLKGTSGPPRVVARTAEGMPTRHDVSTTGRAVPARTSGLGQVESRIAEGQPVQHTPGPQDAAIGPTGSGQLIGGPVRRA